MMLRKLRMIMVMMLMLLRYLLSHPFSTVSRSITDPSKSSTCVQFFWISNECLGFDFQRRNCSMGTHLLSYPKDFETHLLLKGNHLIVELCLELVEALLQVLVDRVDRLRRLLQLACSVRLQTCDLSKNWACQLIPLKNCVFFWGILSPCVWRVFDEVWQCFWDYFQLDSFFEEVQLVSEGLKWWSSVTLNPEIRTIQRKLSSLEARMRHCQKKNILEQG